MIQFTRGGGGWNQTRRTGVLAVMMAALPIGPRVESDPKVDLRRITRTAAAIVRTTDRELDELAEAIRARVAGEPRFIRLRDEEAMRDWLRRPPKPARFRT